MKKADRNLSAYSRIMIRVLGILFISMIFISSCKKTVAPTNEEIATAAPSVKGKNVDIQMIADGFVSPLGVYEPPDSSKRLFVVDQIGKIYIIDPAGNKIATPFLDITNM